MIRFQNLSVDTHLILLLQSLWGERAFCSFQKQYLESFSFYLKRDKLSLMGLNKIIQLVYLLISSELCIDKFALNNYVRYWIWLQSTPFSHMPVTKNYIYYFKMSFDLYVWIKGITICQKRKLYFSYRWTTYVIILYNTYIWKVL